MALDRRTKFRQKFKRCSHGGFKDCEHLGRLRENPGNRFELLGLRRKLLLIGVRRKRVVAVALVALY